MSQRPLLLFPSPERAERELKHPGFQKMKSPSFERQFNRLQPSFNVLKEAFERKSLTIQNSAAGINPEFALVFEIVGTVESFYTAVKNFEGLEWMFDCDAEPCDPNDDFYYIDKSGEKRADSLSGKVYCVMSNQQAMSQLLSLWERYRKGETEVFKRGHAGLREIFTHIKKIRKWSAQDRVAETGMMEYWRESLISEDNSPVRFEVEVFFRLDSQKRHNAIKAINQEIQALEGRIVQQCLIEEIGYHGMLVELPKGCIQDLINRYEEIGLSQVDDVMFFRPVCQSVFVAEAGAEKCTPTTVFPLPTGEAVIGVLDGMPMQNHSLLRGRVIIDDPDNYQAGYESKNRVHGTSMVSLAIYGDLQRKEVPISTPVYVRPILRPKQANSDNVVEVVPNDRMFIDVLHCAVKRMMEGENGEHPTAPNVKVINLSVGDPNRQLASTMSPIARLLDFLAYKYNILFIISAGNHPEIVDCVQKTFDELSVLDLEQRSVVFADAIKNNQRNHRVLAPAESLNALTIGALYDDFTDVDETARGIWAVDRGLPSPISAIGNGYRSIITPDLFYFGGRKFIKSSWGGKKISWVISNRKPGCLSAAPLDGTLDGSAFSFGTSDAAAQITHEAAKCHDVLNQVFLNETGQKLPIEATAIVLKGMLVHGASWAPIAKKLAQITGAKEKQLSKWLGNGIPNVSRVMECTKERITLIGLGSLKNDEGNVFKLPLPFNFSSTLTKRKLTVTLSYISPIAPNRQAYRGANLWFDVDDGGTGLVPYRQNTNWQAVRRGTLQHEIFTGESPIVWNRENLVIKVSCKDDAMKIKTSIPYCLFVSFEVAEGIGLDVYADVSAQIRQRVQIPNG